MTEREACSAVALVEALEAPGLAERVARALRATGYPALRAVEVSAHGGLIVLHGRVPSYYLKQLAQAGALTVPGVQELRNDLEVVRS
jgi:osmotically-inducible protein OsmY